MDQTWPDTQHSTVCTAVCRCWQPVEEESIKNNWCKATFTNLNYCLVKAASLTSIHWTHLQTEVLFTWQEVFCVDILCCCANTNSDVAFIDDTTRLWFPPSTVVTRSLIVLFRFGRTHHFLNTYISNITSSYTGVVFAVSNLSPRKEVIVTWAV